VENAGYWGINEFADAVVQLLGLVAPSITWMSEEFDRAITQGSGASVVAIPSDRPQSGLISRN
jgi:hypothetical protein